MPDECLHDYNQTGTHGDSDLFICTKCDHEHSFKHKSLDYLDFVLKINKYKGVTHHANEA